MSTPTEIIQDLKLRVARLEKLSSIGSFKSHTGNRLIGYKVMDYDPNSKELISGADRRLRLDKRRGATHRMRGKGIFLGATSEYVLDYYANFEYNALITYSFSPDDVLSGNLLDREPEISVSEAQVLKIEIFDEDMERVSGE